MGKNCLDIRRYHDDSFDGVVDGTTVDFKYKTQNDKYSSQDGDRSRPVATTLIILPLNSTFGRDKITSIYFYLTIYSTWRNNFIIKLIILWRHHGPKEKETDCKNMIIPKMAGIL